MALQIFRPKGGCERVGWYLDFLFEGSEPPDMSHEPASGYLVFGRCVKNRKQPIFQSKPIKVYPHVLNRFEFGRAQDVLFLVHNGVLAEKAPANKGIDLTELKFELGDAYQGLTAIYMTHTFIGIGYMPTDIADAQIGQKVSDVPYHRYGFRLYVHTFKW
jgi:hypothetical protein